MDKHAKIYVAGHRGLVGSALMRNLEGRRAFIPFMMPASIKPYTTRGRA